MTAVTAIDRINTALNKLHFVGDAITDSAGNWMEQSQSGLATVISEIHRELTEGTDQLFTIAQKTESAEANVA